jgi:hypothetical protein
VVDFIHVFALFFAYSLMWIVKKLDPTLKTAHSFPSLTENSSRNVHSLRGAPVDYPDAPYCLIGRFPV